MKTIQHIGIVGGGAWGTALASVAARAGRKVLLWAREQDVVSSINADHENRMFLAGIKLDPAIRATNNLSDLADCDALLSVTPAQVLGVVAKELSTHLSPGMPFVICSKGIEQATGRFLTQVLTDVAPDLIPAILSGPSFASDVAKGFPTAVTLACEDEKLALALAEAIGHKSFRPYVSGDPLGAQIGGAVKNVIAIACGISEGKGFGASARAALTTRGFAELQRFGAALGARPESIGGLSGLGDLILTCNSAQSRNMSLGIAMGQGKTMKDVLGARNSVSEGVFTAAAVVKVAENHGIEMPISKAVHDIVSGKVSVDEAITSLMSRPIRSEIE